MTAYCLISLILRYVKEGEEEETWKRKTGVYFWDTLRL
jgi:hypothetical protein